MATFNTTATVNRASTSMHNHDNGIDNDSDRGSAARKQR